MEKRGCLHINKLLVRCVRHSIQSKSERGDTMLTKVCALKFSLGVMMLMHQFEWIELVDDRNMPNMQIGKHVSLGPGYQGAPYEAGRPAGYQQGPYPYHQAGAGPAPAGQAVYIGKQVTLGGQPGYSAPAGAAGAYQPTGTYGGPYATGVDAPGPYSVTGAQTLGPCVNNGFRCYNNTDCCSNACDSYNNNFCCIPEGKICDRSRPDRTDLTACCYPLQCLRYATTGYTVCQEVNYPIQGVGGSGTMMGSK